MVIRSGVGRYYGWITAREGRNGFRVDGAGLGLLEDGKGIVAVGMLSSFERCNWTLLSVISSCVGGGRVNNREAFPFPRLTGVCETGPLLRAHSLEPKHIAVEGASHVIHLS
jgi:hypothetical protein